jgi:hypothetical protein
MLKYSSSNGSATPVLGRGIAHLKSTREERTDLAVDVLTKARPFLPSYGQAATLFDVPLPVLRQRLKIRREENGNRDIVHTAIDALTLMTGAQLNTVARALGSEVLWHMLDQVEGNNNT